jgi:membrane protein YdbS with pleckstrin-like domain
MTRSRISVDEPEPSAATLRPALPRLLAPEVSDPPDQEFDVAYVPFAGRSLLGGFLLCLLLTVVTALLAWYFDQALFQTPKHWLMWTARGVLAAVWLVQLVRWAYRQSCFYVRLTTRRILYHRGVLYQWCLEIPLADVTKVKVRRDPLERLLGVGNIDLFRGDEGKPFVTLTGIRAPEALARLIRPRTAR